MVRYICKTMRGLVRTDRLESIVLKFNNELGHFYLQIEVCAWHMLAGVMVGADRIVTSKRLLERHIIRQGVEKYGSRTGRKD